MKCKVTGKINTFPGKGGWSWVGVLSEVALNILKKAPAGKWKFTPITARVGKTEWKTSLLPLGEGKYFVALKASVRKAEGLMAGDTVEVSISV